MPAAKLIGAFELVSFKEFNVENIIAKIDTGAYSGALHATNIRETVGNDGVKRLEFYPLGKQECKTTTTQYRRKPIKSSNGQAEERYVVKTHVSIQGTDYPVTISLSDRSAMMKPALIGRQFLRRHHLVVDVQKGLELRYSTKGGKQP